MKGSVCLKNNELRTKLRIIAALMAAVLVFTLLPFAVLAQGEDELSIAASVSGSDNETAAAEGEHLSLFNIETVSETANQDGKNYASERTKTESEPLTESVTVQQKLAEVQPLTLTITPPSEYKCGEPITFKLNASGGYGNYTYRLYMLMRLPDGDRTKATGEYDSSRSSNVYTEKDEFTYTFMASGWYLLRYSVMSKSPDGAVMFANSNASGQDLVFEINDSRYPTVETIARRVADAALAAHPNDKFAQVVYCHDYILEHTEYDYSYLYYGETGVLCHGKGTCESYHRALAMMLGMLGIKCERAESTDHVWSCVQLGGIWMHIDPTWNDGSHGGNSFMNHMYFGVTDELIRNAHPTFKQGTERVCTSLAQNYFIRTADTVGEIKPFSDPIMNEINSRVKDGQMSFDITVTNTNPRMVDVFYPIIGYYLDECVYKDTRISVSYSCTIDTTALKYIGTYSVSVEPEPVITPDYPIANLAAAACSEVGKVIVSIDGVEYKADASGSFGTIRLNNGDSKLVTANIYNTAKMSDVHSVYPVGMKTYLLKKENGKYVLKHIAEMDNILQYAGCSIRITGVKGIRMITGVPTAAKSALMSKGIEGYTLVEYGTLVAWMNSLNGKSVIYNTSPAKGNYAYKKGVADPVFAKSGNTVQYTNVLVGFTPDQCIPDLAMRPYMVLKAPSGKNVVIYGGTVQRSIGYIAYQNRKAFAPGTESYKYIWDIIHHVYKNKYDADYRK